MNIREIARLAEVTPGTVSKVLNNYPDISESTRKHVLKIIEANGYDPREKAKTKKAGPLRIGLVSESVFNPIYSHMEDILSIQMHNAGYMLTGYHDNFYIQDKAEKLSELCQQMKAEKPGGIFYIGGNFEKVPQEVFAQLPAPTVFLHTVLPQQLGKPVYSSLSVSHAETARLQMRRAATGHRHLVTVISSFLDNSVYGLRVKAYQDVLRDFPDIGNIFLETDYQLDKTYYGLMSCLQEHPETDCVVSVSDIMVPAILRAIQDAGRTAGKDISVLSFDGEERSLYALPSVATYVQPMEDMMHFAASLMLGLIAKTQKHQQLLFQPVYMPGETFGK